MHANPRVAGQEKASNVANIVSIREGCESSEFLCFDFCSHHNKPTRSIAYPVQQHQCTAACCCGGLGLWCESTPVQAKYIVDQMITQIVTTKGFAKNVQAITTATFRIKSTMTENVAVIALRSEVVRLHQPKLRAISNFTRLT